MMKWFASAYSGVTGTARYAAANVRTAQVGQRNFRRDFAHRHNFIAGDLLAGWQ
jgi:hypothetical protein